MSAASATIIPFVRSGKRSRAFRYPTSGPIALGQRLDELDGLSRLRPLTVGESDELECLLQRSYLRRRRLPGMIERMRGQIDGMLAELSPADRLRELRAESRRAWERLRDLEEELEPGRHVARLEAELKEGSGL